MTTQHQGQGNDPRNSANALIKIVRESTERFKDVSVGEAEGYALQFGCVSGPNSGAMGLHYANGALVVLGAKALAKTALSDQFAEPEGPLVGSSIPAMG